MKKQLNDLVLANFTQVIEHKTDHDIYFANRKAGPGLGQTQRYDGGKGEISSHFLPFKLLY